MSSLRDYRLTIVSLASPLPSASIKGDFIKISAIQWGSLAGKDIDHDLLVKVEFDDSQSIIMRCGDTIRNRPYERITLTVLGLDGQRVGYAGVSVLFTAGQGEFIVRNSQSIPNAFATLREVIPAGATNVELGRAFNGDAAIAEIRLCIPTGQASGLWLGSQADINGGRPMGEWLDVGVVDYKTYNGAIFVTNPSASDVLLSVGVYLRRDR